MEISFPGKRVLVTGAARGIGRAIVHAFAEEGAEVHATDVDEGALRKVAAEAPSPVWTHSLDVTDSSAVDTLVARIGSVDIAVHVAGGVLGQTARPLEETSDTDWRAIQAVNVDGAFHLARAVAPGMKTRGEGRIVIISSGAGLRVSRTGIHSYGTAKTAQIGLARQLASELGPHGITVNTVAPGFMPTSPDYVRQWEGYGEAGQRALIEGTAMRRLGRPADIAGAVLFLASGHAGWITGQTLAVMGGP
ncbi:MAG: SDR family NAD(P)-dependent oxidoreductase [Immundisolibacterales bacterium]|nr:SDR family NAD(P)-dependent oxidoreductase [Immundisolibacterales bacterium]